MDNLFCDLDNTIIEKEVVFNEVDLSIILCGLTLYKDSIEMLKTKTEYVRKEIKRTKDLKERLQKIALEIEKEYDEKE